MISPGCVISGLWVRREQGLGIGGRDLPRGVRGSGRLLCAARRLCFPLQWRLLRLKAGGAIQRGAGFSLATWAVVGADPARRRASSCRLRSAASPVPKCEGPRAPSSWSGKGTGAGGTLSVVWKGCRDRGHPPSLTSDPLALDAIMDRALAKNPDDRYATAEEFSGDLRLVITELEMA